MIYRNFVRAAYALAAIVSASGSIAFATPLPSSSFNHRYNGDVYNATNPKLTGVSFTVDEVAAPDPNYVPAILTGVANTFDGMVLAYKSPINGGAGAWFNLAPNWIANVSDALGWTMEFRLKIGADEPDDPTLGAFRIFAKENNSSNSTRRVEVQIGSSFVRIGVNVATVVDTNSNTDGYHDFRIMQPASSGNIVVWRDGVQVYSGVSNTGNNNGQDAYFGDGSSGAPGGPTIFLDYFCWDSTGPYEYEASAIPEPSSIVLLGITGIGLIGWARRRRNVPSK